MNADYTDETDIKKLFRFIQHIRSIHIYFITSDLFRSNAYRCRRYLNDLHGKK